MSTACPFYLANTITGIDTSVDYQQIHLVMLAYNPGAVKVTKVASKSPSHQKPALGFTS